MSSPIVAVRNNAPVEEAAKIMARMKVRHLLVEDSSGAISWVLLLSLIWLDILGTNLKLVKKFQLLKYGKYSFDLHYLKMTRVQDV